MKDKENLQTSIPISAAEIERCIVLLNQLNTNTTQIFEIPKDQRTALIKAAGKFSRPERDELSRRKKKENWLQNAKWKNETKLLERKLEFGMPEKLLFLLRHNFCKKMN